MDQLLRWWRIRKARAFFPEEARFILDVGCHDGALFRAISSRIEGGIGVDPVVKRPACYGRFRFIRSTFPGVDLADVSFDIITLLAVLEHVDEASLESIRDECERLLTPGGTVIVTMPSPMVDRILEWLSRARLVTGMSIDEHHGSDPSAVLAVLSSGGLVAIYTGRFEFGLNNLMVFRKPM